MPVSLGIPSQIPSTFRKIAAGTAAITGTVGDVALRLCSFTLPVTLTNGILLVYITGLGDGVTDTMTVYVSPTDASATGHVLKASIANMNLAAFDLITNPGTGAGTAYVLNNGTASAVADDTTSGLGGLAAGTYYVNATVPNTKTFNCRYYIAIMTV